jgi:hypothetical protein
MRPAAPAASRAWVAGGLVAAVTVIALVAIGRSSPEQPLDPRSDARLGTSALVALVDRLGGTVEIGERLPEPGAVDGPDVVVLLADRLDDRAHAQLADWVTAGGTLVVVDPGSSFTPEVVGTFDDSASLAGVDHVDTGGPPGGGAVRCDVQPIANLDLAAIEPRNGGVLYEVPPGADACIRGDGDAYIVATNEGAGAVVAIGGSGMLVNAALAHGENAAVVAALVAPLDTTDVLMLEPTARATGAGGRSLIDLISPNVKRGLVQLGIAFAVYALWRALRLGRPVDEAQPVAVAGSELVAAVGSLLDRSRSPQHAAVLLRTDLRRWLTERLGVPAGAPTEVLVEVAATRTGVDKARLRWALGDTPVTDDAGLVALADTIDRIHEEVFAHA